MKRRTQRQLSFWGKRAFLLGLLLILPSLALWKLSARVDYRVLLGYLSLVSLVTICFYYSDKKKAQREAWRVSEGVLQFLALIGGWAAAFLSQQVFRHKTQKKSFQFLFWFIVFIHQVICYEIVTDSSLTRALFSHV